MVATVEAPSWAVAGSQDAAKESVMDGSDADELPHEDICWVLTESAPPHKIKQASARWYSTWQLEPEEAVGATPSIINGTGYDDAAGREVMRAFEGSAHGVATAPQCTNTRKDGTCVTHRLSLMRVTSGILGISTRVSVVEPEVAEPEAPPLSILDIGDSIAGEMAARREARWAKEEWFAADTHGRLQQDKAMDAAERADAASIRNALLAPSGTDDSSDSDGEMSTAELIHRSALADVCLEALASGSLEVDDDDVENVDDIGDRLAAEMASLRELDWSKTMAKTTPADLGKSSSRPTSPLPLWDSPARQLPAPTPHEAEVALAKARHGRWSPEPALGDVSAPTPRAAEPSPAKAEPVSEASSSGVHDADADVVAAAVSPVGVAKMVPGERIPSYDTTMAVFEEELDLDSFPEL